MLNRLIKIMKSKLYNIVKRHDKYIFIEDYTSEVGLIIRKTTIVKEIYNNKCIKSLFTEDGVDIGPISYFAEYVHDYTEGEYFFFTKDFKYYKNDHIIIPKGSIRPIVWVNDTLNKGLYVFDQRNVLFKINGELHPQYGYVL